MAVHRNPTVDVHGRTYLDYWYIHEKAYDLRALEADHPGGYSQLHIARGKDCTTLVESLHAMTPERWRKMIHKYEAKDAPPLPIKYPTFSWTLESDGGRLYSELKRRVKKALPQWQNKAWGLQAPPSYFAWLFPYIVVDAWAHYKWLSSGAVSWALLASFLNSFLGFAIMHTGAHGAISRWIWLEELLYLVWSDFFKFWHPMWHQHHDTHHMFTGYANWDPDMNFVTEYNRRRSDQDHMWWHHFQKYYILPQFLLFPGQMVGQFCYYLGAFFRTGKLFNVNYQSDVVKFQTTKDALILIPLASLSFLTLEVIPLLRFGPTYLYSWASYYIVGNILYWSCTFTNHEQTHPVPYKTDGTADWAETQIVNSANFYVPFPWFRLIGGMCYQIEHHLFPGVHPSYYALIHKVVKQLAKEKGLRYTFSPHWASALYKHMACVSDLGNGWADGKDGRWRDNWKGTASAKAMIQNE